jgi:endonuclease YncB( thermonuclease family)
LKTTSILAASLAALLIAAPAALADYSGRARVIDGDTFSIRQQRIRVAAIDACERDQTGTKNGVEWACGIEARRYLARMIDGQHVRCVEVDRDQYNRLVGQCFVEDRDIGLEMVKAGHAELLLRYLPKSHPIDLDQYQSAEDRARQLRQGLWGAEVVSPSSYRRSHASD